MKEYIKKMLADNEGNPSSMRLLFLSFGLLFTLCFCIVWAYISLYNRTVTDVPSGIVAILGTLLVGKSAQKVAEVWGENKPPAP